MLVDRRRVPGRTCSAASAQRPRSIANSASSDSLSTSESVLDIAAASVDDSANSAPARSSSPVSRCASAPKYSAVSRHGLHGGSWATAKLASAIICSGPAGHITARNIARAESNDAVPSTGTRSNEAASTIAAQRSRLGGLPGQHRDPAGQHGQRRVVLDRGVAERREPPLHGRHVPGLVGRQGQLRSPAGRIGRRSVVFNRCSTAIAGDPLDSYQSAARRCSFSMTSGSTRRSSPSRNSRNSAW